MYQCLLHRIDRSVVLFLQLQNVFVQFRKLYLYTECLHRPRLKVPWPDHDQVSSDPAAPQAAANTILQILTHGFPKFKFSNEKFFGGTKGQVMI